MRVTFNYTTDKTSPYDIFARACIGIQVTELMLQVSAMRSSPQKRQSMQIYICIPILDART